MRFITFDQVAAWYDTTKPIISKNHTAVHDVRPIGQRKRKCERIKRIDANTYALCDGNYGNYIWGQITATQHAYENALAPIVWTRESDGDYVCIRNHNKGAAGFSRYGFLMSNLPPNMSFRYNQQGEHWITAKTGLTYQDFPLPKGAVHMNATVIDAGVYLKFRVNKDGTFTRVGEKLTVQEKTVDKELKRDWKPKIAAFYVQAAALAPMLDTSWNARNHYEQEIATWCKDNGHEFYAHRGSLDLIPISVARCIVALDDHDLRVPVMALVVANIGGKNPVATKEDLVRIKSAYNRLMNKFLGMYETEEI